MNDITEILEQVKTGELSVELAQQMILESLHGQAQSPKEQPILIGHLNKSLGFNGFDKIEIGAPVYSLTDRYYFEMKSIIGSAIIRQYFYKHTLTPYINFIVNESN